jgi:flagellar basal body rod protein FlgG
MASAAHALRYWERKQEVVANNLANTSTDGFKAQRVFARLMDGMRPAAEATTDLTTGTLRQTGNGLDVAFEKEGFLVVSTPNGERYTRGGSLRISPDHKLVDADGNALLGIKGPITLQDGPVEIDHNGEVKQNGQMIDRLRVEAAPQGVELSREGHTLFVPPVGNRRLIAPEERTLKQGYLEDSNVNSIGSLVDMIAVQRAYASVQKVLVELDRAHETAATQLAKPV